MEMLNSFSTLLSGNMWTNMIDFFAKSVVNYGWAIILFTICLKLVLSPLDIFQRLASQKQARVNSVMQPEINKINEKYGNDKAKVNEETQKLYKKYKVNLGGMCLTMLITMAVSLTVFFTLFGSIRAYGDEKLYTTYQELDTAYTEAEKNYDSAVTEVSKDEYVITIVQSEYEKLKKQNSWLWVKNVWKSDTNTSQFVDKQAYLNYIKNTPSVKEMDEAAQTAYLEEIGARYDKITSALIGGDKNVNGYFVLIILSAVVSFLTQFLSAKLLAPKGQKMGLMNKIMMVVIPATMVGMAASSNVVFTLYIIANSIMTALISTILTLIFKRVNKGKTDEQIVMKNKKIEVVEYSRNYKK